jgi:hypothetical protein
MTINNMRRQITVLKYKTLSQQKAEHNPKLDSLLETLRVLEECKRQLSHEQIREGVRQATEDVISKLKERRQ